MPNDERILETIPNGIVGLVPTKSCTEMGAMVDKYLTTWREHREHEHQHDAAFKEYYKDAEATGKAWHDDMYHTGDLAWKDEEGYYWYVGRIDDVIKSSGYRIGPFEIENVIMELPYVLECGVSAAPDEVRGQVVKASIVLTKGTEPTEELKKEIQSISPACLVMN